jgi:UDP-N-acetylmuramate dehydrogenase
LGNCGSFFKNPVVNKEIADALCAEHPDAKRFDQPDGTVKMAAGWLIEKAGWKGYRRGDAGVHEKQALVMVNYGNATGSEILALARDIVEDIETKFHVTLEMEVNTR